MSGTRPGSNTRLSREASFSATPTTSKTTGGTAASSISRRWFSSNVTPTSGKAAASTSRKSSSSKASTGAIPASRRSSPMAPVEWGKRVEAMLVKMRDEHPSVRGIRRIMEFDKDPRGLTLSPGFIEGVNLLEKFGWSFDINPNHTQMDFIREWVPRISSGVPMILDHCGKPGIKQGAIAQYREDVKDLARYPNMWIKLSDLPNKVMDAADTAVVARKRKPGKGRVPSPAGT